MAGGGVGEAMAIGALMGAGVGGVSAAAQDKDPLQGALLGAVGGAAGGGLGAGIGGAVTGSAAGGATGGTTGGVVGGTTGGTTGGTVGGTVGGEVGGTVGGTAGGTAGTVGSGLSAGGADILATGGVQGSLGAGAGGTAGGSTGGTTTGWMAGGQGTGFAPALTNAQAYGAGTGGGLMGLAAGQNVPATQEWPTGNEDEYTGSLNYFKYDPTKYKPDTPTPRVYQAGYAEGGIASLGSTNPMNNPVYPQSQQTQTAFSTSPQYPNSLRSAMAADYDTRTNPTTGTEFPMGYAGGGGIGFVRSMQPGGAFGDASADLYGAQVNAMPFLKDIEPGGFLGATTPGRMDYQDREQRKQDEENARKRAEQEAQMRAATAARNTSMQGMAGGGIASLGGYSDGGRLTRGPGDGVSDSIPASIGGRQPARLADGEFVVPARIVSELGNGSTDAGARRLYDMMDRVQSSRSKTMGKGKVAKNTKAYQALPA